jgi:hypothetical protein
LFETIEFGICFKSHLSCRPDTVLPEPACRCPITARPLFPALSSTSTAVTGPRLAPLPLVSHLHLRRRIANARRPPLFTRQRRRPRLTAGGRCRSPSATDHRARPPSSLLLLHAPTPAGPPVTSSFSPRATLKKVPTIVPVPPFFLPVTSTTLQPLRCFPHPPQPHWSTRASGAAASPRNLAGDTATTPSSGEPHPHPCFFLG